MSDSFEIKFDVIKKKLEKEDSNNVASNLPDFEIFKETITSRRLILYGCGVGGYALGDWLNGLGIITDGYADSKRTGIFPFSGKPIITLNELLEDHSDANVLISSKDYDTEIYEMLLASGFPITQLFHFPILFPNNPSDGEQRMSICEFSESYLDGYKWAYDFFPDDESKRVVIGRIETYLLATPLAASNNYPEYFDPNIISLGENEIVVDGGAYYGDSIVSISRESGGCYQHIYSFEPDVKKCEMMKQEFALYKNVTIIPKGLWNQDAQLSFSHAGLGASSSLVFNLSDNIETVSVTSLDVYFRDKELPTFIKMDIEGSEFEALRGAERIIKANKPTLAICAYHKPEDVFMLTKLIHEYNPEYRVSLRQPCTGLTETTIYAV